MRNAHNLNGTLRFLCEGRTTIAGTLPARRMLMSRLPRRRGMEAYMNARIFYAAAPLALLLATGAHAQYWYESPLNLTQDQQNSVFRTIVRENTVPAVRETTVPAMRPVAGGLSARHQPD